MKLRMRDPARSTKLNSFQQAARNSLKPKLLKIGYILKRWDTALG
jgi:hypothetical protein